MQSRIISTRGEISGRLGSTKPPTFRGPYVLESILNDFDCKLGADGRLRNVYEDVDAGALQQHLAKTGVISRLRERYETVRGDENKMTNKLTVPLCEHAGWTIALTTHSFSSKNVHSAPCPWLTILVSEGDLAEVDVYHVDDVSTIDPLEAKQRMLNKIGSKVLKAWEPWEGNDFDTLFNISSGAIGSIWLNFIGPCISPYVHIYSEINNSYVYSSFSGKQNTCNDFISRVVKEFLYESKSNSVDITDIIPVLDDLIPKLWAAPDTADTSRWILAQALYQLDPQRGKMALRGLVAKGGGLGAQAASQLSRAESYG